MSTTTKPVSKHAPATAPAPAANVPGSPPENADIDRDTPQPHIHVEERKLSLNDFLMTMVKINGSAVPLRAESGPMIRGVGRARSLDCPPPTKEIRKKSVDAIMKARGEDAARR